MLILTIVVTALMLVVQICLCTLLKNYKRPYLAPGLLVLLITIVSLLKMVMIAKGVPDSANAGDASYAIVAEVQWLATLKPVLIQVGISLIPFIATIIWRGLKVNARLEGRMYL